MPLLLYATEPLQLVPNGKLHRDMSLTDLLWTRLFEVNIQSL